MPKFTVFAYVLCTYGMTINRPESKIYFWVIIKRRKILSLHRQPQKTLSFRGGGGEMAVKTVIGRMRNYNYRRFPRFDCKTIVRYYRTAEKYTLF